MFHLTLPAGYQLRPAALTDFEPVLHLRQAQNLADYGETGLNEVSLKATWFSRDFHVGLDHWVITGPGGNLAAYGELRNSGGGHTFQAIFAANPNQWEDHLALVLLDQIEMRASQLCRRPPFRLTCRISDANLPIQRLVEAAGYHRTLAFHTMQMDLDHPPARPDWSKIPGIQLRSFIPEQDDQAVYQADEEASADKGYHRKLTFRAWSLRMGLYASQFDPSLWFLAVENDIVVGGALNFIDAETKTGWIDHLGVRRAWRKRGIGAALLLESANAFHQRGLPRVRLNVDSHSLTNAVSLYVDVGFRKVQGYCMYEK